ncbi:MAG: TonB-dependent receptor [Prevotella sp.]|uniref:TonB-dependent receptor n=2 Tax=Xylanibacter rodentium TaxID=2736289 RepID=A0ABX2AZ26_9BACT|nr:TonB-dependent receptor [Prevotella sp. PJ1A]NPE14657.1 TonB-dependent receptor [Xylanibacter rodentium]NPE39329.1 TonB-dependent receptor [Prevotella sp. PCJ2]
MRQICVMNRFIMTCLALAYVVVSLAQGTVKGRVLDKQTNEVLQFVNIRVTQSATGKMVKGAITDAKGTFNVTGLADGKYVLTVSFMGYKDVVRNFEVTKDRRAVSYNALYLAGDQKMLKEVQVTGQRSQMKLEVDRKSFSVDQVLAAAGGSASDLLENIPSVEVTTDGEISLRGNSSVEVWINGKASGLTSDNRAEILQQIPAESIEKIEVIDNPSAKFSPEGSAGIINIILKRDRRAGYYGSVRAGAATSGGWNTGGSINYSSGKLDAFANVGYRRRKNNGGSLSEQTYKGSNTYQNYEAENNRGGGNLFARAGLTWHFTDKDDLSFSGMTMQGKRDNESIIPYHYGTVGAPTDSRLMFRRNTSDGDMRMYHAEMGYTHTFSEAHKLDFNLSFGKWKSDDNSYYQDSTTYIDPAGPTEYMYQYRPMFINNRSWEAKLDYENQIMENLKLEAGYNGRFSHENTPQESWMDGSSWAGHNITEDKEYFNRFIYDMDVHALYATLTTKVGRLGVMAGLRGEYWRVNTESYTYDQEHDPSLRDAPFKKDYFQLFPSLFLNYPLTETSQLQLNYTRRLRRPWGGQLNSFKNTSDASMVSFGNPELTPEYTNSFSLNYLKTWQNHTLSVGTYYRPTTDVIQTVKYNVDDVIYSTSENVAKSQSAGVELILKDKLFRILDLTTTVNAYYYKLDGFRYVINDQTVTGRSDENFSWDARMLASFILPYDISLQATGNYRSRTVITQGYRKPSASLDLGLRKSFLNKQFALSVNWRDVFNSRRWKTYTNTDSFERYQENWRDPRANITLTWNFGNMSSKKKPREEMNSGMDDENQSFGGYGE